MTLLNAVSREMHEGNVLLNLRKRFERELIYVSPSGIYSVSRPWCVVFTHLSLVLFHFYYKDIHWKYPGVCEPLQDVQHLWDRHGGALQRTRPGRKSCVSQCLTYDS